MTGKIEGTTGRRFPSSCDGVVQRGSNGPSIGLGVRGNTLAMGRVRKVRSSAPNRRRGPGERLRALRLVLGLTLRDVHQASIALSRRLRNSDFQVPASRLHEFETRNVVPSIHRLYTLAATYGYEMTVLLAWYGIPQHIPDQPVR